MAAPANAVRACFQCSVLHAVWFFSQHAALPARALEFRPCVAGGATRCLAAHTNLTVAAHACFSSSSRGITAAQAGLNRQSAAAVAAAKARKDASHSPHGGCHARLLPLRCYGCGVNCPPVLRMVCSLRRCVASLLWHLCMCYDITSAIRDPSCCTHPLALLPTPHSACDPWRAATSTITHQQQAAHITGEGQCTSVLKHRGKRRVAPCNAAVHVSHM